MGIQKVHYNDFSVEDFALNEKFRKWVLDPDEDTDRFWRNFIQENPSKENEITEARELVELAGLSSNDEVANEAYLSVWHAVQQQAGNKKAAPSRVTPLYKRLAAVVAGIIIISSVYILRNANRADIKEYKTAYSEQKEVVLGDGSKVTLNSNSTIKHLREREVFVEGEAYFDVAKKENGHKFLVRTNDGLDIEVLGTEFNVNTRRETVSVYLQEGSVKVTSASGVFILMPGEQVLYKKSPRQMLKVSNPDAEDILAWKGRIFIFNDESLGSIASQIEEYYGVTFTFTDGQLSNRKFTGRIPSNDLDIVLQVLSEALEIRIEKETNRIIIHPGEEK